MLGKGAVNKNLFVQNQLIDESQDHDTDTVNEEEKAEAAGEVGDGEAAGSEVVGDSGLMTSNPIMNKKMMQNYIAGMNSEKDKLSTFQTPLPQMRFVNRGGVDQRLSKLLGAGGAEKKNVGGGIVFNNLAGAA